MTTKPEPFVRTPAVEPVPKWCHDAAVELIQDANGKVLSDAWMKFAPNIAAIIAKHAPKEQPQPEAREEAKPVRRPNRSHPMDRLKELDALTSGKSDAWSNDRTQTSPASPVWPRYAKNASDSAWTAMQTTDGKAWTAFRHRNPYDSLTHEVGNALLRDGIWIETDANGNALPTPPAPASSGGEAECKRFKVPDDYAGVVRHKGYGHVEVVTAADHDRIVAERDATIAELRAEVERLKQPTKEHSVSEQLFIDEARQQAAQCWCDDETKDRVMDPPLAESVAKRIAAWMDTAAQAYRSTDFYRGIVTQIGEKFGKPAYTSDDGSVQQDVLALRVPELVDALRTRAEDAEDKCAYWYDEFTRIAHHFRVSVDPDDTQKLNPEGTAKLAASFRTRAEAAEAEVARLNATAFAYNDMRIVAEAKIAEMEKHEAQTHERLGAILGTHDSLEECARRLKANRDAIHVQWQSLHDEREEQYAALRRRGIRFVKVDGTLEAIVPDDYAEMFKSTMPHEEVERIDGMIEGCMICQDERGDVGDSDLLDICRRFVDIRQERDIAFKIIREKGRVIDELSNRLDGTVQSESSLLAFIADIRHALGDNGKRMRTELLEYCTQLAAANERVAAAEDRYADVSRNNAYAQQQVVGWSQRARNAEALLRWWKEPDHPIGSLAEKKHKFTEMVDAYLEQYK